MKLSQIREEKNGTEQPTGVKAWFQKNKGIVLAGTAVVIVAGGFMAYKYFFKKKGSSPAVGMGDMGGSDLTGGEVEFS